MTAGGRQRGKHAAPQVVLDTNLVLSALVFRGGAAGILRSAWQEGVCVPLISTATTQELMRVLSYPKFQLLPAEQHELLADYLPYARTVPIPQPAPDVPGCRDPFDLPFLHLAVAGKAGMLVSGDRDLLALSEIFPIPILALAEFLAILRDPSD